MTKLMMGASNMMAIRVSKITVDQYNKLVDAGITVSFAVATPAKPLERYKAGIKLPMADMKKISAPAVVRKLHVCNFPHVRRSK